MNCAINVTTLLLTHQRDAVAKVLPSRVGALFMEMGTGKSRTAIELARLRQEKISQVIWFCPVTLKLTVKYELLKHTQSTEQDIYVFNNKTNTRNLPACAWYIVGIESMSASNRVALTVNKLIDENSMVIVDESSYIKGHKSMRTQRITVMSERARYRLILTGTPISQGVVDLYAQMRFLSPKILGYPSFYSFSANHLEYSERYKGLIVNSYNTEWLAAKIKPYVYQVTKDECLDLPSKMYKRHYVDLTEEQQRWYKTAKDEILLDIDYEDFTSYTIFRLFTALQQITCGFWQRGDHRLTFNQHRINALIDIIDSIPPDEKIIVWAKYRYDIELIAQHLTNEFGADSSECYYGDLNENQRQQALQRWRHSARFLIATPSCGGHGLTLNEASYVIFYNNGFKYAERIQAEDRNHRIGQTVKVLYIDICTDSGIDNRIMSALANKENAVAEFKQQVDAIKEGKKEKIKAFIANL